MIIRKKIISSSSETLVVIRGGCEIRFIATLPNIVSSYSLSWMSSGYFTQYLSIDYYMLNTISQIAESK